VFNSIIRLCVLQVLQHKQQPVDQQVVDASVESPSGKPVYSSVGQKSGEGQFYVLVPDTYTFCFINRNLNASDSTNQTQTDVFLQFELRLADGGLAWRERQDALQKQRAREEEQSEIEMTPIRERMARMFAHGEQVRSYYDVGLKISSSQKSRNSDSVIDTTTSQTGVY